MNGLIQTTYFHIFNGLYNFLAIVHGFVLVDIELDVTVHQCIVFMQVEINKYILNLECFLPFRSNYG